jgi:hypothetical protein
MLGNITQGHGLGKMAGSYEDDNEAMGFIKCAECFEWLRNRELLMKDTTPWSLFCFVVFHYLDVLRLTSFSVNIHKPILVLIIYAGNVIITDLFIIVSQCRTFPPNWESVYCS